MIDQKVLEWEIIWTNNNFYDYITTNLDIHLKFLPDNNVITSEVLDKIINIFESHKDMINNCESCLVHHDLADHNIIYNTEKKWLEATFDWEAMTIWDPMLDLWSCPTWWIHYPRKEKLIEWYKSIKQLPDDYKVRMDLYELRTLLWKIMFSIKMNFWEQIIKDRIWFMFNILKQFN